MCNLNILIRKKNFDLTKNSINRLAGFMMATTTNSFTSNDDGDGVYFNCGTLQRQVNKVNFFRYRAQIALSNVIISHQRIATSGMAPNFIQPFAREGFVIAHNGVIGGYATKTESDTWHLFDKFLKEFKKARSKKRHKKVQRALDICLNSNEGRYSLAIYDMTDQCVYYVKEKGTSIKWFEDGEMLYLTTNHTNEMFIPMLKRELTEFIVEPHMLYKITPVNDYIEVERLGITGKKPPKVVKVSKQDEFTWWNSTKDKGRDNMATKGLELLFETGVTKDEAGLIQMDFTSKCEFCQGNTDLFSEKHGMAVCQDCVLDGIFAEFCETYHGDANAWHETNKGNEYWLGPKDDVGYDQLEFDEEEEEIEDWNSSFNKTYDDEASEEEE